MYTNHYTNVSRTFDEGNLLPKPPERSKYDDLHDKYEKIWTKKAGTRYERLAAIVFKSLDEAKVVIHDLKLRGETSVQHQIDVTIAVDGTPKRILIECKDFDVGHKKVGLSVVRNFWGVVDDLHPDASVILTSNGFTAPARRYAKGKGIKLAVLREFNDEDWEGRLKSIEVTMKGLFVSDLRPVKLQLTGQQDYDKVRSDMETVGLTGNIFAKDQPIYLNTPERRYQIADFIHQKVNGHPRIHLGLVELAVPLSGCTIEVGRLGGVPIDSLVLSFDVIRTTKTFTVTRVAALLLEYLDQEDLLVWEDELTAFTIAPESGEAVRI